MSETMDAVEVDRALSAKDRAMWALGDYPAVAAEIIPDLGPVLVEACGGRRGDRVLDVAASSGNAAIPAALASRRERGGQRPHSGTAQVQAATGHGARPRGGVAAG